MVIYRQIEQIIGLMDFPERIRNASIIAHVDHGKTSLADSLLGAAGIIPPEKAGQVLVLDSDRTEQERQMTIYASNVSLVHEFRGQDYLINLIDTPGHIDFNAAVIRSLRAVDGALLVVDAVEGPKTQTETVLMEALQERVRPILFINKVDTLIKSLRLKPQDIQYRFARIIIRVNKFIQKYAPLEHKEDWQVRVEDGSVAFGSALHRWGLNLHHMKAKKVTFKEIVGAYTGKEEDVSKKVAALQKRAPLYEPILDMLCEHLPSPTQAQPYRQSRIWSGDLNSPMGKSMAKVDPNGPLLICITTIKKEEKGGLVVAIGRIFSGTVEKGKKVRLVTGHKRATVQQTYMIMVEDKMPVEKVPAGNMVGLSGLPNTYVGETVSEESLEVQPFEQLEYVSDPVITVAVKPENVEDIEKFAEFMHILTIEDPSLHFTTNKESGEHLLSGMGELHLQIVLERLNEEKLNVKMSEPTVIFRETIAHNYVGPPAMGKSPNKHNKLWITLEKLPDQVIEYIKTGKISEKQTREERNKLLKGLGWSTEDARNIITFEGTNILVNKVKGRQHIDEVLGHIKAGFGEAMNSSILTREPAYGLKVNLVDVALHEDPVHRGPAQILPMTWRPIWYAMLKSNPQLLEPISTLECSVPRESDKFIGNIIAIVQKRRGKVLDIVDEEEIATIKAEIPVSESFGLSEDLRSSTEGRVFWAAQFSRWSPVPESAQLNIIRHLRQHRGLDPTPPKAEEFFEGA